MPYLAFLLENEIFKYIAMELGSNILKVVQQFIRIYILAVAFPNKKIIWRLNWRYFRNH